MLDEGHVSFQLAMISNMLEKVAEEWQCVPTSDYREERESELLVLPA
jgi:hypothetical protein